jgi:hypothetical protein
LKKHLNTMKKLFIILAMICLAASLGMAQKVKPSEMSPATVAAFKSKLGITAIEGDTLTSTDYFYTKKGSNELLDNIKTIDYLKKLGATTVKSWTPTVGFSDLFVGSTALTDGYFYTQLTEVLDTVTVTGVKFMQGTQGSYTADNTNAVSLWSFNGTTWTKIAEGANTGTLFSTVSNNVVTAPFTGTLTVNPGLYQIMWIWNASATTTAPMIRTHNGIGTLSSNIITVPIVGTQSGTAFPASPFTSTSLSPFGFIFGVWLY